MGHIRDNEDSLAVRAAWLHHIGRLTQAEVAHRLGVPGVKAHRLIARAVQNGAVRITIVGNVVECARLEDALCRRFDLQSCEVVPDLHEENLPLAALGAAGGAFLRRAIEGNPGGIIGIGNGRTLAACVDDLPPMAVSDVRFVSLLGGLTRNHAANPFDVTQRLAQRTGADSYVMPAPFFADTADDRAVILAQRSVQEVLSLAAQSALMVAGIGVVGMGAHLVASRIVTDADMHEALARGAVGEMLGHFFDARGDLVETSLAGRLLSLPLPAIRKSRVVVVAGGVGKTAAIEAVLRSRVPAGLITDERTALSLVGSV